MLWDGVLGRMHDESGTGLEVFQMIVPKQETKSLWDTNHSDMPPFNPTRCRGGSRSTQEQAHRLVRDQTQGRQRYHRSRYKGTCQCGSPATRGTSPDAQFPKKSKREAGIETA